MRVGTRRFRVTAQVREGSEEAPSAAPPRRSHAKGGQVHVACAAPLQHRLAAPAPHVSHHP